jgi:hypothetical protein
MGWAHRINMRRGRNQYPKRALAGDALFRRAIKSAGFGYPARLLVFIGRAAEYVRAVSCRKAVALLGEATTRHDARDAAWCRAQAKR